jgi:L-threonylcarbamoyladenylate synthase
VIFPTETVYGIGCAPEDGAAIASIFIAKGRPADKPLAIHVARQADVYEFAAHLTPAARAIVNACWPGPVAIIVERAPGRCDVAARFGATISVRCPDDPVCAAILGATGPLAATSANVSSRPAFDGTTDDMTSLPEATMAIIAGPTRERRESTVLDCSGEVVRIVRSGATDPELIERALAGVASLQR